MYVSDTYPGWKPSDASAPVDRGGTPPNPTQGRVTHWLNAQKERSSQECKSGEMGGIAVCVE